uniref:Uncharacterized protein n=1 Tax=Avena sativa TaxID=4498 RepID=A0ACD6AQ16_AVESA
MELQNATGLGWDPIAKTMDADDDWWKNHLAFQIRPDHAKFRNGPPANLEQQDVMFRKAHVTGESAAIAGEEEETDNEAPIMLDDDTCGQASSKKTGKRKHVEKDFFSAYNNALNTIVSRHTDGSSGSKGKLAMNKDQREVFAAFATIEGRLDWLQRTHDEMNK